jgi:hypothetical protein
MRKNLFMLKRSNDMRKNLFMLMLLVGMVALLGQGVAMAAITTDWSSKVNKDIVEDEMNRGNDYTFSFQDWGYKSGVGADKRVMNPCPQWWRNTDPATGDLASYNSQTGDNNCPSLAFTSYDPYFKPVTGYGSTTLDLTSDHAAGLLLSKQGTIVDDLYSKVVDEWEHTTTAGDTFSGTLDQDLDMLFVLNGTRGVFEVDGDEGAHNSNLIVDESLDQSLAYLETSLANLSGALAALNTNSDAVNGITQRLVIDFAKVNTEGVENHAVNIGGETFTYGSAVGFGEAMIIDQWVAQWLRDIDDQPSTVGGGSQGINQYYSSWFMVDDAPDATCTAVGVDCSHTYNLSHDTIQKNVDKTLDHDHNSLDGIN